MVVLIGLTCSECLLDVLTFDCLALDCFAGVFFWIVLVDFDLDAFPEGFFACFGIGKLNLIFNY